MNAKHTPYRWLLLTACLVLTPTTLRAQSLEVRAGNALIDPAVSLNGFVEVVISAGTAGDIDGYDFEFAIDPRPGATGSIRLTGASTPLASALFPAGSPTFVPASSGFPDLVTYGDNTGVTATPGATLFNLSFEVSPDAIGDFGIEFFGDIDAVYSMGAINELSESFDGTVTVVPEPGTALLSGAGCWMLWRRRRPS